jgi:hypothetical protein
MAVLRVIRPPAGSRERYDAVHAMMRADSDPPLGLIMHSAGEIDGHWQIVDVWESEEYAERFDTERLKPALESAGAPSELPPRTTYRLHHLLTP